MISLYGFLTDRFDPKTSDQRVEGEDTRAKMPFAAGRGTSQGAFRFLALCFGAHPFSLLSPFESTQAKKKHHVPYDVH